MKYYKLNAPALLKYLFATGNLEKRSIGFFMLDEFKGDDNQDYKYYIGNTIKDDYDAFKLKIFRKYKNQHGMIIKQDLDYLGVPNNIYYDEEGITIKEILENIYYIQLDFDSVRKGHLNFALSFDESPFHNLYVVETEIEVKGMKQALEFLDRKIFFPSVEVSKKEYQKNMIEKNFV